MKAIAMRALQTLTVFASLAAVAVFVFPDQTAYAVATAILSRPKLTGHGSECPWSSLAITASERSRIAQRQKQFATSARPVAHDAAAGLRLWEVGGSRWWTRDDASDSGWLLPYLLADHAETAKHVSLPISGDVVIDVGAHVGVFAKKALENGASQVIAMEPDPLNLECLRRNLGGEIRSGRVVVWPKGAWSSETVLTMHRTRDNSGNSSVVLTESSSSYDRFSISLTTIDRMVQELKLGAVTFIKMDIEGAEREAIAGAAGTLKRFRPRLMLDSYHRPDDLPVFRRLIRNAVPSYTYECTYCEMDLSATEFVPHVTFWQAD